MKAAVLGCGPAGLIAAWAISEIGGQVDIYSRKIKSQAFGAQYLHSPIPGLSPAEPDFEIDYIKLGSRAIYANKVYGDPTHVSSWESWEEGFRPGWSMRKTYDLLWDKLQGAIFDAPDINQNLIGECIKMYDLVVSAVPLPVICYRKRHTFIHTKTKIRKSHEPFYPDSIVYNGRLEDQWHRGSNIDGETYFEYHHNYVPDTGPAVQEIAKPQSNDCTCYMKEVLRVGRFGRWQRDILVDSVYNDIMGKVMAES